MAVALELESGVGGLLKAGCLVDNGLEERNFSENLRRFDAEFLLPILDAVVRCDRHSADRINQIFQQGSSIYEVRTVQLQGEAIRAIERRVSSEVATVEEQIGDWRVRRELAAARSAIFGLTADYVQGLHHGVKAVENSACGIVEPNNAKSTLGRVAKALEVNQGGVFSARIGTTKEISSMCALLWDTERRHRHGGEAEREPDLPTREEAEAAYSLVVLLSDWFTRGVIFRRS
jgi:hypothetical protein